MILLPSSPAACPTEARFYQPKLLHIDPQIVAIEYLIALRMTRPTVYV